MINDNMPDNILHIHHTQYTYLQIELNAMLVQICNEKVLHKHINFNFALNI